MQLDRIQSLVKQGEAEGADRLPDRNGADADKGCFFPPTLMTNVHPASTCARVEIFGPVLVAMSFRTPDEAVALANNTEYGLAASVWTEIVNLALDIAPKIKAGVVWINSTNLFDAASGFGGYKESGYGREGGREGVLAYTKPKWLTAAKPLARGAAQAGGRSALQPSLAGIDRTAKMYIGGKQARPDGGYSRPVAAHDGTLAGEVGEGNRKDIRNAVEAARKAAGWAKATEHLRAQILYYIAENLDARADEFAGRLAALGGVRKAKARREVDAAIARLFAFAAWADKYEGAVHRPPFRGLALAMNEPVGVIGIVCPGGAGAARLRHADGRGDRHRQHGGDGAVGSGRRSPPPTSTRCSTPRTCRAASSTSSPAIGRSSAWSWPSTTRSTPSGRSAPPTWRRHSRRRRPATSSRPGARRSCATGSTRRCQAAARCCGTRRR